MHHSETRYGWLRHNALKSGNSLCATFIKKFEPTGNKCESKIRSSKELGERKHKHVKRSVATAEAQITEQMTAEQCSGTVPPAMSTTSMGLTPRDNFQKVTAALTRCIRQGNIQNPQGTRGALCNPILNAPTLNQPMLSGTDNRHTVAVNFKDIRAKFPQ